MSNMKCPDCGHIIVHCLGCEGQYEAYNPGELLRLIEAVDTIEAGAFPFLYAVAARNLIDAIKSALSGDRKPLEKLAGE